MTALALPHSSLQWNWPRVGALSGALSLHFIALLLLLVPPAALQLLRPPPEVIPNVRILEPPPKIEEPPLPTPPKIMHEVRTKPAPKPLPVPVPTPPAESALPTQQADPAPPRADITPTAVDVAPTALAYNVRTRIAYPREAARLRQHGTVVLSVLVGADGVPQTVDVEKSSGFRSLDEAARSAVSRWTFQPGTRNGVATALWARVPITFTLEML